jgi:hypothetical protein
MTISMYDAAATAFLQGLRGLQGVLAKGEAFARETGIAEAELTGSRLAPDMFPLTRQVQIATDHAKGAMSRLAGQDPPKWEDTETSFAELRARVGRAVALVESVPRAAIEGSEARPITIRTARGTMESTGMPYLLTFALPNFWFHVTTAYALLRHRGVPVGKGDFLARG